MAEFPEEVVKKAFGAADGRCECLIEEHGHTYGMCMKVLEWKNRGQPGKRGAWEAHWKVSPEEGGTPVASNCEILCWDCYQKTVEKE
ncbi:MAG: hypothetical protein ACOC6G_03940 [Thermoproteota archaeon]